MARFDRPPPSHVPIRLDYLFKVVVVGDSGAGKTALVAQYVSSIFADAEAPTIGVDFSYKIVRKGGCTLKLALWDTAGQERFRALSSSYYRGCHGVVLAFDVGSRASFDNVRSWLDEISLYADRQHVVVMLVGCKVDTDTREVSIEEAHSLATNEAVIYAETSAKTRTGVDEAFDTLVCHLFASPVVMASANLSSMAPARESVAASTQGSTPGSHWCVGCRA